MLRAETVIIGAGVVGLAVARALALRGTEVLLLDQDKRIGQDSSSRSSEVIHAGIYYPSGSQGAALPSRTRRSLALLRGEKHSKSSLRQACGRDHAERGTRTSEHP